MGKGKKGKKAEAPKEEVKCPEPEVKIEEPCVFNCQTESVAYRPNSYPGLLKQPKTMAVVGSEAGSYDSLCKLIHAGFRCADRVYAMVPWGNYVVFRAATKVKIMVPEEKPPEAQPPPPPPKGKKGKKGKKGAAPPVPQGPKMIEKEINKILYFLFDGCTCNVNHFRYMDLNCGTGGLLYFEEMHKMISYILMSRIRREEIKNLKRCIVDDVCQEMYGAQHI